MAILRRFGKGHNTRMPKLDTKEVGIAFITFLGDWAVRLLREHLANSKLDDEDCSMFSSN